MATSIAKVIQWQKDNPERYQAAVHKYRKIQPLKYLFNLAKRRARLNNLEFNIELSDLNWPEYCPLLEIKLDHEHPNQDFHGSIDRINPKLGYLKGNVLIVSYRANKLKNNSDATELQLLAKNLQKFEAIS